MSSSSVQMWGGRLQDHPYRNICSVRRDAATSLIELQFDMLSPDEAEGNTVVPSGLPFCTLRAQMRELEVVFLSRFVFELLRYINLLLKLRPASLQDPAEQPQAAEAGSHGTSAQVCACRRPLLRHASYSARACCRPPDHDSGARSVLTHSCWCSHALRRLRVAGAAARSLLIGAVLRCCLSHEGT